MGAEKTSPSIPTDRKGAKSQILPEHRTVKTKADALKYDGIAIKTAGRMKYIPKL